MNKHFCFLLSTINGLIPKSNKRIAIYGRRMLNDNSEALLDYLISKQYNNRYKIFLLVHRSVRIDNYRKRDNVTICTNSIITLWILFRTKYVFHTHGMSICTMIPKREQIIFNLWHGSPLKAIGKMIGDSIHPYTDSYFLSSSPFFASINEKCFGYTQRQLFIGSNPRNDLLFSNKNVIKNIFSLNHICKVVIFMPTFRKSSYLARTDAECDFPIITKNNIGDLDDFLYDNNVLLIIKPHPYQDGIDYLLEPYKNIKIIFNEDLRTVNIKLYELLACSDALITDFSSVYFDYLLLNRPIAFAIDNFDSYSQSRGYTIANPLDIMPGEKIFDLNGMQNFIENVVLGKDDFSIERSKVNNIVNTHCMDDSCRRILDFCMIKNE
jgi:hypothetical protein